ncbi:hypothetical protein CALCODRAFT_96476 [Calocera cornea HHB12733]|uniref:Uncharacterized protein n=1 Tax=Calocera cornea HHB12733 TaxID=1353952 RepID=A0A165IJS9_9BASI|nr:hypothetical protein CALCODRAFT_96476 [Calocera cornea HHB12733]
MKLPARGRSKSAPPAFAQTMMGYVDSTPLISAETYNLSPSRARARAASRGAPSRRASVVSARSAHAPTLPPTPQSPHPPRSFGPEWEDSGSTRSSLTVPSLSPLSAAFSLSSSTSTSTSTSPSPSSPCATCPTCRSLASPPRRPLLHKLSHLVHLPSPAATAPVYMDQAHFSFFFPRAAHPAGGCGCGSCVRADPAREEGEKERARRVRAYELRGWATWTAWGKVVWSQAARERRRLGSEGGEGGIAGSVKVSRVYEVEW